MAAPLVRKRSQMAAKVEGTVGTAESLSASEAVYRVYNHEMNPTIQTNQRQGQGLGLTPSSAVPGGRLGQTTFIADLFGGASVPAQLTTFFNACGLKLDTATFTPESRPPEAASSGAKTLTIAKYVDGIKKQLHGAMGNAVLHFPSGAPCYVEYTFTGCYAAVSDVAVPAYTPPTTVALLGAGGTFTVGGVALKVGEIIIDLGNVVTPRKDITAAGGYHSCVITDRLITFRADIEATKVATYDPHADWLAQTERAISLIVGSSGNQLTIAAPKAQIIDVQPGDRNGLEIFDVTYQCNASDLTAAPGDDEFSIVVA